MYVDDSLALLPRKLAGPMACLLVCLACCLFRYLGTSLVWVMQLNGLAGKSVRPASHMRCSLPTSSGFADPGGEAGVVYQWSLLAQTLDGNLVPYAAEAKAAVCSIRQ